MSGSIRPCQKDLIHKIEQKHEALSKSFYNPSLGLHLQNIDSWIAENIINHLTEKNIVCLSVHDSFITAKKYEAELRSVMETIFYNTFGSKPIIK